jgi:hypothetical protein
MKRQQLDCTKDVGVVASFSIVGGDSQSMACHARWSGSGASSPNCHHRCTEWDHRVLWLYQMHFDGIDAQQESDWPAAERPATCATLVLRQTPASQFKVGRCSTAVLVCLDKPQRKEQSRYTPLNKSLLRNASDPSGRSSARPQGDTRGESGRAGRKHTTAFPLARVVLAEATTHFFDAAFALVSALAFATTRAVKRLPLLA